jgi:hypothetical protein
VKIHVGDEVHLGAGQRFRVLAVVPFERRTSLPFVRAATGRGHA